MATNLPDQTISIAGAPSYWLRNDRVELYVSALGGHLAPVNFRLKHRWVCPYSVPPWEAEEPDETHDPVLRLLRGDFFCLPFGGEAKGPIHGFPPNAAWELVDRNIRNLVLRAESDNGVEVTKTIALEARHRAVYQTHEVSGLQGRYPAGYHAILQVPEGQKALLAFSGFTFGQVAREGFSEPANSQYGILKPSAQVASPDAVPLLDGRLSSLREYPNREGFDDLVMLAAPPDAERPFGWSAATFKGYVWLSLKDARDLPATLLWFSNGGRHNAPWGGRHRRRIGIEEVCSWFAEGTVASRREPLRNEGIPTTLRFSRSEPRALRSLHAVHPVPANFGRVAGVEPGDGDEVKVTSENGHKLNIPLNWRFLRPDL